MQYQRHISPLLKEALADTPAVLLTGPRQAGKTTLARQMVDHGYEYVTLDDELTRLSAQQDPVGFIQRRGHMVIDEIQRAPELLLAIKMSIDDNRKPGRFLLTGSANILTIPKVADSLAGRMETLRLLPLSQSEIVGNRVNWIDYMLSSTPGKLLVSPNTPLVELV
jgi:predicted AAA+ superfamily ATPase